MCFFAMILCILVSIGVALALGALFLPYIWKEIIECENEINVPAIGVFVFVIIGVLILSTCVPAMCIDAYRHPDNYKSESTCNYDR